MNSILAHPVALVLLVSAPLFASGATLPENPVPPDGRGLVFGGGVRHAKADSAVVLGADGTLEGRFENAQGDPDWQGWSPVDWTQDQNRWHVSTYAAAALDPLTPDNRAWWCGEVFDNSCGAGYGHSYDYSLEWSGTVDDPSLSALVRLNARANIDIQDVGWDILTLQVEQPGGGWLDLATFDWIQPAIDVSEQFTIAADGYAGPGADQVHLRWRFTSDGGWDDEDCMTDTDGAAQLDLIQVQIKPDGAPGFTAMGPVETCEPGDPLQWTAALPPGAVGNFGQVWPALDDLDPCAGNLSPQVAFVDDGLVVPGTGGSSCIDWCYGPGGWVVNSTGGLAGPNEHIHTSVVSPVLAWPDPDYGGLLLEFDVYRHFPVFDPASAGIFYQWLVRTAGPGEDITENPWLNEGYVYYGGPDFFRYSRDVSQLVSYQNQQVQVALGLYEIGWYWGWDTDDATPAPYFDNVRLTAYRLPGPVLLAHEYDLAQDGFPAGGSVDLGDLAANSVRFDAAVEAQDEFGLFAPGDSLSIRARELANLTLDGVPTLNYRLIPNPLFDPYRTAVPPGAGNTATAGAVACSERVPADKEGRIFFADLPDTGFFFPGDVVHYYFRAADTDGGVSILPPDTTGFGMVPATPTGSTDLYDPLFTARALPTVTSAGGEQPAILLWDDSGSPEELDAWLAGLSGLPMALGADYDLFVTRAPRWDEKNGLGTRAGDCLGGYGTILYSAGERDTLSLARGRGGTVPSPDLAILQDWLDLGDRTLLLMGDNLVTTLEHDPSATAQPFLDDVMLVQWVTRDVGPAIDGQSAPEAAPLPGDPVFASGGWLVDGSCPGRNRFDEIAAVAPAVRSAEFLAPGGVPGAYGATAAAVTAPYAGGLSEVVTVPCGMAAIGGVEQVPGAAAGSAGDKGYFPPGPLGFLYDVLHHAGNPVSGAPPPLALSLAVSPNPFNPRTEIRYTTGAEGPVSLALYDLRGRRVRRLVDEVVPAGEGLAVWDGRDDRGRGVSSGVYFCILEAEGGRRSRKVTLLR